MKRQLNITNNYIKVKLKCYKEVHRSRAGFTSHFVSPIQNAIPYTSYPALPLRYETRNILIITLVTRGKIIIRNKR